VKNQEVGTSIILRVTVIKSNWQISTSLSPRKPRVIRIVIATCVAVLEHLAEIANFSLLPGVLMVTVIFRR